MKKLLLAILLIAEPAFSQTLPTFVAIGGEYSTSTPRGSGVVALGIPAIEQASLWSFTMHQESFYRGRVIDTTTTGFALDYPKHLTTTFGRFDIVPLTNIGGSSGQSATLALSNGGFVTLTFSNGFGVWAGGVVNKNAAGTSTNALFGTFYSWGTK